MRRWLLSTAAIAEAPHELRRTGAARAMIAGTGVPSTAERVHVGLDGELASTPIGASSANAAGYLPFVAALVGVGVLGVAVAHRLSDTGVWDAQALLWAGVVMIVLPTVVRQLSRTGSRDERVALVLLCGMGLFFVKLIANPSAFTFPDEFAHTYNVQSVLTSGHLFTPNPLVTVTPLYPGLASVTAALVSLSGLTIFQAGILVSAVARVLLMIGIFLLFEQAVGSARVAGLAATLYAGNPNYAFYSAEFGYETLALPLAVLVLFVAARRTTLSARADRLAWTGVGVIGILAVVVTHHVTSYALAAALLVAAVIRLLPRQVHGSPRWSTARAPWDLALVTCAAVGVWFVGVAASSGTYLSAVFGPAAQQGLEALLAGEPARQLFQACGGGSSPIWQQVVGFAWLLVMAAGLIYGRVRVRRVSVGSPIGPVLLGAAAVFLPVQALRLTPASWETANRSSEFLFLGCALVLAVAAFAIQRWPALIAASATLVVVGGMIVGWSYVVQLPPPYVVRASNGQDVVPEGETDARWALQALGPDNVMMLDPSNSLLMAAYGRQRTFTGSAFGVQAMLLSPAWDSSVEAILDTLNARYIVVDRRARSWTATYGFYPPGGAGPLSVPSPLLDAAVQTKFDDHVQMSRVADSGNIAIYAVDRGSASGQP